MDSGISAREQYERGRTLRQNKMYKQALTDLQEAIDDPKYRGQAYTQTALCLRALGRHEEAVNALRHALNSSSLSSNESLHVLYLLGQSLETLGRCGEAIEAYNWVRQEDARFFGCGLQDQKSVRRPPKLLEPATHIQRSTSSRTFPD